MTIFPFIKGQIELKITRVEFLTRLKKMTEKEYPLIGLRAVSGGEKLNEYGRELYEDSFMLWKVSGSHSYLFTTIHGRFVETENRLLLKYHIRFNIWTSVLIAIIILFGLYLSLNSFLFSNNFDVKNWFGAVAVYALFMWMYNDCASDDKSFIKKLTE